MEAPLKSKAKPRAEGPSPEAEYISTSVVLRRDLRGKLKAAAAIAGLSRDEYLNAILEDAVGHFEVTPQPVVSR